MKKLLILLLVLLFSPSLYAVCPVITESGEEHHLCDRIYDGDVLFNGSVSIPGGLTDPSMVKQTTAAINLFVRAAGNDSNDCLSAGAACLTIQEAVGRVPTYVNHNVTIDAGEGTFAGMVIRQFTVATDAIFLVKGTLGDFAPATGTNSGTADGGDTRTCIDSGQTWTVDNLRGTLVLVDGEWRVVRDNTATTINLVGPLSNTCSGKSYTIQEQKTVLNTGGGIYGRISVATLRAGSRDSFRIHDFKINGSPLVGVYLQYGCWGEVKRMHIDGATYGIYFQNLEGEGRVYDTFITNSTESGHLSVGDNRIENQYRIYIHNNIGDYAVYAYPGLGGLRFYDLYIDAGVNGLEVFYENEIYIDGFYLDGNSGIGATFHGTNYVKLADVHIESCGSHGISIQGGCGFVDFDSGTVNGSGGYGVYIGEDSSGNRSAFNAVNMVGNLTISNNTSGGVVVKGASSVFLTNVDGSGNGGYGLDLSTGSFAVVTTDTGITGAAGDATITDGSIPLTWATDFASDGDVETNITNGCRIERKD